MQKLTLIYFFITLLIISTKVNSQRGKLVGAKSEIKDVKTNKEVQELGKYSVQEYNRNLQDNPTNPLRLRDGLGGSSNGPLRFVEVVEAQSQVVSGIKYYLKVVAMQNNGITKSFDAVVVVKPWVQYKQLLNFGPSSPK